jgi:hypothetical protein
MAMECANYFKSKAHLSFAKKSEAPVFSEEGEKGF